MQQKQSFGQASYDLLAKSPETINVIDMQREMQKKVPAMLDDIIAKHRSFADLYYIVYILRKHRVTANNMEHLFFVRETRPEPSYDMSLFSYDNKSSTLKYHWTIPDENTCLHLLHNKDYLSEEEKQLFDFVKKFSDGTLV